MRKLIYALAMIMVVILMQGCATRDEIAKKVIFELSDIENDENYVRYLEYKESGKVSEQGEYIPSDNNETGDGPIKVSFARNNQLEIQYYLNGDKTSTISSEIYHCQPGDSIYALEPNSINSNNAYVFDGFRVYQIDDNNNRSEISTNTYGNGDNLVYQIPSNFDGTSISIVPLGKYEDIPLTLSDVYETRDGEKTLQGNWLVNDIKTDKNNATVKSAASYRVEYDYGEYLNSYYYVSSEPSAFKIHEDVGRVEFSMADQSENNTSYKVIMHPFIELTVYNKHYDHLQFGKNNIIKISINDQITEEIPTKNEFKYHNLKVGDKIVIVVDEKYKITSSTLKINDPVPLKNAFEYVVTVDETFDDAKVDIAISERTATAGNYEQKSMENATVQLTDHNGNVISEGDEVNDNEQVTLTITPVSGFYITGKDTKNDVYTKKMKYVDYVTNVNTIISEHPAKQLITIELNKTGEHGNCTYYKDSDLFKQNPLEGTVSLKENEKLKLVYKLTDSNYVLKDSPFYSPGTKETTITVDSSFSGKTLNPEDYFTVQKK